MNTLQTIFNEIGNLTDVDYGANDKGGKIHTYLDTYDKLFKPFQKGCSILEIGLAKGDSILLWDKYFTKSKIVGCDLSIVFSSPSYKNDVELIACDGTKPELLDKLNGQKFDIIIDDSSHVTQDQIDTFNMLKGSMKPNGVYIIEDILAYDIEKHRYAALHHNIEVVDMRSNGRFDNMLIIFRDFK